METTAAVSAWNLISVLCVLVAYMVAVCILVHLTQVSQPRTAVGVDRV